MLTSTKVSSLIHYYGWGFEEVMRAYDLLSTREALKIACSVKPTTRLFEIPNIDRSYLLNPNYISEGKSGRVFRHTDNTIIKYYFKGCEPQSIVSNEYTPQLFKVGYSKLGMYKVEEFLQDYTPAKLCSTHIQLQALEFAKALKHNDIHLNNVMYNGKQFKLIDLEY